MNTHIWGHGLPGSLILFDPHALVSQCQMLKKAACASGIRTNIVIFYLYISNSANPFHLKLINVFIDINWVVDLFTKTRFITYIPFTPNKDE